MLSSTCLINATQGPSQREETNYLTSAHQFIHTTLASLITQATFAIRGLDIASYMELIASFYPQPENLLATIPWFSQEVNNKFETNYALREVVARHSK